MNENIVIINKICPVCKIEKPSTEFSPNKKRKDGLRYECKECRKRDYYKNQKKYLQEKREYNKNNKEKISLRRKQEYQENKDKIIARANNYYHSNKETIAEKGKIFREHNKELIKQRKKNYNERKKQEKLQKEQEYKNSLITVEFPPDYKVCSKCHTLKYKNEYNLVKNKKNRPDLRKTICKDCQKEHHKKWRAKNIDIIREREREKYHENHEKVREKKRKLRQTEKYKENLKLPENRIIRNMSQYIRYSLGAEGLKKDGKASMKYVGCTREFFRNFIQFQFTNGMNWNNYGKNPGQWSVDHYIPRESFNILNKEEQNVCFGWKNCQPMWHTENETKQDTMPDGSKARDSKHQYSLQDKINMIEERFKTLNFSS